jgi:hypothetical protein
MGISIYIPTPVQEPAWTSYFDDTHWTPGQDNFWNGSAWQSSSGSQKEHIWLNTTGTWADGFRPSAIRVYHDTGEDLQNLNMFDTNSSAPWLAEISDYTSGQIIELTFVGFDIWKLQMTAAFGYPDPWHITDIQFLI